MRLKPVIYCFLLDLRLKPSGSYSLLKYAFAQKLLLISYMIVVTHHNKGVLIYSNSFGMHRYSCAHLCFAGTKFEVVGFKKWCFVIFSFLSKLEERVESDVMHFTVCDIIYRQCPLFRKAYVPYLTNQSYQDATYQRLM